MISYGGMMRGGIPGPGGMSAPGGAPGMGFKVGGFDPMGALGGIGSGIKDWWGQLDPMQKAQILGGAAQGIGSYMEKDRMMDLDERRIGLQERGFEDAVSEREERQAKYRDLLNRWRR